MYKYGATSKNHIISCARIACETIKKENAAQALELVIGTFCAETNFGRADDNYQKQGIGLAQFDLVRFNDVKARIWASDDHRNLMGNTFGVKWLSFEQLEYSPLLSAVMCRFGYLFVNEPLPAVGDLKGQAKYWKRYWNSSAGAGTPEHYINSVRSNFTMGFIDV